MIVSWPGRVPLGVTNELAHSNDLFPTLLGLSGADPARSDGVDLAPLWIGRKRFQSATYSGERDLIEPYAADPGNSS